MLDADPGGESPGRTGRRTPGRVLTACFSCHETGLRLAATRRPPRHLLSFVEDARLLSVLRRVGPVHRFCHTEFKVRIKVRIARA